MDKTEHEHTIGSTSTRAEEHDASSLIDSIKNGIADMLQEFSETVGRISDRVGESSLCEQGKRLAHGIEDSARSVREFDYRQADEQARRYVRENPGRSLLVAGAVGMVIGAVCRRG